MRVGGLATGMDIESMVNKLMDAERIPYTKLMQDRTKLTWKQDAFRDLNKSLLELDNMVLDMKLSKTYNQKKVSSTQENAVTGTPSGKSGDRTYRIEVTDLASSAINMSGGDVEDIDQKISSIDEEKKYIGEHEFYTYNADGEEVPHSFTIDGEDTIEDVINKINETNAPVRAFYDETSKKVIMETTRTGKYNPNDSTNPKSPEIYFTSEKSEGLAEDNIFTDVLKLDSSAEKGGTDTAFKYNGEEFTSKNNSYELDGTTFHFHNKTDGVANVSVTTDDDAVFDSIVQFVDKYNEVVEKFNDTQREERYRDFPPLTDEQKKGMSDDEIKKWEEKSQSGILRGESIVSNGLFNMRSSWYSSVDSGQGFSSITEIGITTSNRYLDGGKLEIDEEALRKAISENPEGVQSLLSNSDEGASRGIIHQLDDQIDQISKSINNRAGKGTSTLDNFALGKRMKEMNKRISDFEVRLTNVESRYWNQFTQMEKAIQRMNNQSSQLFSQFGE